MKNTRKRKLDILLSKDVPEKDDKVKNLKQNVPEPMSIEETQSESESEDEVEDEEDDQTEEVDEEVEGEPEDKPDSEPEVIEFVDPIQLLKKKRAEQLAKRAKMT